MKTKKITLKQINDIFKKYGDLDIKVNTPYGYKKILNSDITAIDSKIIRLVDSSGNLLEGSPDHLIKTKNGSFVKISDILTQQEIQTVSGLTKIESKEILSFTEDLYDIQVSEVEQYYSNNIVSHNSNLALDLPLFLFFNTTTKGTTAIDMFNRFRTNKDEVRVRGVIEIDGDDYIIERNVVRKLKRDGSGYNTKTELSLAKVMADGSVLNMEGEQRRETEEVIKKSIGSYEDFILTIISDADTLEKIIHTKPTEKGRILSRFMGLEILEDKETIVKDMKSGWSKGLKSDIYNIVELETDIIKFEESIESKKNEISTTENKIIELKDDIEKSINKKEELISQKIKIDSEVINIRPDELNREIEKITSVGKSKKEEYDLAKSDFDKMVEIVYDEDKHNQSIKKERDVLTKISQTQNNVKTKERLIKELKEGEFCPTCKQPLKDVDHTSEIENYTKEIEVLNQEVIDLNNEVVLIKEEIKNLDLIKKQVNEYDRKSLTVDKLDLEINKLRLELKEKKDLKTKYEQNVENINKNSDIDSKILGYNTKITTLQTEEKTLIKLIERLSSEIKVLETNIKNNKETIQIIKTEEEVKNIFDVYIKMIGKNGVGKLIMKTMLPIINGELDRLLCDTTLFKLEVDINDKNEVDFMIEKEDPTIGIVRYPINEGSGYEKTVSALALRCVMSKVSCLPKPNVIVFDEVFGKIAPENLDLVGTFFQKISEMFQNVFIITHVPQIKDWGSKIITVTKKDNISFLNNK
jgi:DNA repair exonuclease SbcCD ATPase subunit